VTRKRLLLGKMSAEKDSRKPLEDRYEKMHRPLFQNWILLTA
jgi:hypothetical protein